MHVCAGWGGAATWGSAPARNLARARRELAEHPQWARARGLAPEIAGEAAPPVLRSAAASRGLAGLAPRHYEQLRVANQLMAAALELIVECAVAGAVARKVARPIARAAAHAVVLL